MNRSFSQTASLTCLQCGQPFTADIWLIVDASERSDLLARLQAPLHVGDGAKTPHPAPDGDE